MDNILKLWRATLYTDVFSSAKCIQSLACYECLEPREHLESQMESKIMLCSKRFSFLEDA